MKALFTVLIAQIISVSAWSTEKKTTKMDMTGCLKAINVYSPVYRGKIFTTDEEGWSFIVKEKNETVIYSENGEVYKISGYKKSSETCENVTTDETRGKSGAPGGVFAIYQKVMKDPQNNSYDQRQLIKEACKEVASWATLQIQGGSMIGHGMGMMMSGQGAMMNGEGSIMNGQGGMTGTAPEKNKPAGGRR